MGGLHMLVEIVNFVKNSALPVCFNGDDLLKSVVGEV